MMRERSAAEAGRRPADRPTSRNFAQLKTFLGLLKPYRLAVLGALLALSVAAFTVLGLGMGLRLLVDEGFAGGDSRLLDRVVLGLFAIVGILAAASYARFYLVSWLGERLVADLRRRVYDQVVQLPPAFFEVTRTGEVLSRLTTDTTLLQVVVGTSVPIALRNILLVLGGTAMLLVTSPKLTGVVLVVVPLVLLPIIVFGKRVRRLSRESQDRIADVGAYADESLVNIRTVQAFTHDSLDRSRFAERVEGAFGAAVERTRARALLTALVILLVFSAIASVLWIGGRDVLAGRITAGELSAFVFYAVVVAGGVGALSEVFGDLQRAAGAAERLLELLRTEPEIRAPETPVALPTPPRGAVSFDEVAFRYPSRPETSALDGLSLEVAPGETVAIVGPSGAGKTTVFQLLLRFYDPATGRISIDGVDLRTADPREVRARIGLVPQEPVIFSANAWENIRYGRPEATDEEVLAAADAAHAREFLERLPKGFSTFLGERGVRLSGGQRQRIAIARALLRNPAILLLDEATSSLDAESERSVQEALDSVMVGRTTIIIAHRLATILKAQRIVVMDQGRIVEAGTHHELIERGGLYARLAALQFDDSRALGAGAPPSAPELHAATS